MKDLFMWFNKEKCAICHNYLPKSKLYEFEAFEGENKFCCEKCTKYLNKKYLKKL